MIYKRITAAAVGAVTLAEVRADLRLDTTDSDALIADLIADVTDAAERKLGRALITQTWEAVLDAFPDGPVKLPAPPVQSIVSVTYTDTAGAQQSLTAPAWLLDKDAEPGWLFPGYGTTWPETRAIPNAVRIRLTVGYGDTPASVPGSIKRWIRAHVAQLFNNPEAGAEGLQPMPLVDRLLDPYCIHEVAQ